MNIFYAIFFLVACVVIVVQQLKLRLGRADLVECRWELNEAAHEIDDLRRHVRNARKSGSRKSGIIDRARA